MHALHLDRIATRQSWLGRGLRWPLDRMPKEMAMRILSGPLLGSRWIVGAGIHRCWLGIYERQKQRVLAACLEPGMVACDIGANAGFYSLLMAKRVGKQGRVYAFEPSPSNLALLRRHLEINAVANVVVRGEAVSDTVGQARFAADRGSCKGRLEDSGSLAVPMVTLDHLLALNRIEPADVIKIDVEGAELRVLQGAAKFIRRYRPILFVATHGAGVHAACAEFLRGCGYRLRALDGSADVSRVDEIVASNR